MAWERSLQVCLSRCEGGAIRETNTHVFGKSGRLGQKHNKREDLPWTFYLAGVWSLLGNVLLIVDKNSRLGSCNRAIIFLRIASRSS